MQGWQVCVGTVVVTLEVAVILRDRRGERGGECGGKNDLSVYIHRI